MEWQCEKIYESIGKKLPEGVSRIAVFDLDDTLVITDAKIKVLDSRTGKVIASLNPAQFNKYTRKKNHVLNFEDFEDESILRQGKMIDKIFRILRKMIMHGEDVAIITARSSGGMIVKFFRDKGISIRPDLVYAVNDPTSKFVGSVPEKKKQALLSLIKKGYNDLLFFDDHIDNLTLAKEIEKEKGVSVETIHVKA